VLLQKYVSVETTSPIIKPFYITVQNLNSNVHRRQSINI